jgi:hypothetical protein
MADVEHLPDTTGIHHDVRRGVMMIKNTPIAMLLGVLAAAASARAQTPDLHIPRNVQQAYEAGTRSWDGTPGPAYWQNRADYDIRVDFDPVTGLLRGRETITYVNNSPDTLRALILDIHANYYRIGTARDWPHSAVNLGEGAILDQISIDGAELDPSPGAGGVQYMQNGMLAAVPHVLTPGRTAVLDVTWHYTVRHTSSPISFLASRCTTTWTAGTSSPTPETSNSTTTSATSTSLSPYPRVRLCGRRGCCRTPRKS